MLIRREREISEVVYKNLISMDRNAAAALMMADAPIEWRCGYGIYGCQPVEHDGKFFVEYTTGDTCD